MQNDKTVKLADGKTIRICFTIKTLRQLEKALGTSIIALYSVNTDRAFAIDTIVNGLKAGTDDVISDDDAFNLLQSHCDAGGSLEEVGASIMEAVLATGLFDRRKKPKADRKAG